MKKTVNAVAVCVAMGSAAVHAQSADAMQKLNIKPVLEIGAGVFYSEKSYSDPDAKDDVSWQEAYAKYGVEADYQLQGGAALYGSLKGVSSGTFDQGDAGGYTDGSERKTSLEEWVVGWRSGPADSAKADFSVGRQSVQIADGFLVAGDALNVGKPMDAGAMNRGGAYYLAPRSSFDFTAVLHYAPTEQLNTHWYYLESGNKAQYQPKLWAADAEYDFGKVSAGLTYMQVTDVEDPYEMTARDDLKNTALRVKAQPLEALSLSAEYVHQDQKQDNENAWYAALSYSFDQLKYQPVVGYRYSSFSERYDPLFYGNTDAGFGTWFQGEVAANYAGPYSANTRIHQLSAQAAVTEKLQLGVLAYQFETIQKNLGNLDARELDLFAVWSPTEQISIVPLVSFFKPKKDLMNGGSQVNGAETNTYAQLLLQYSY